MTVNLLILIKMLVRPALWAYLLCSMILDDSKSIENFRNLSQNDKQK